MNDFQEPNPNQQNQTNHNQAKQSQGKQTQSTGGDFTNTIELVKKIGQAMNGKSQKDIYGAILAQAEQGKREGTLTNADLDNFYITLAPLLDGFKRKRLQEIIRRLKQI